MAGLAAEVAVLGAAAGLQADDPLDLDLGAAVRHPHGVGELEQIGHPVVRQPQDLDQLVVRQALSTVENLCAGALQDVSHAPDINGPRSGRAPEVGSWNVRRTGRSARRRRS